ncbi:MAG: acyl-CoA desaturase [Acidimicrobiia bacterium]|nr:acyl-CoA desaturase [Acidimicrobiia bacterium]
MTATVDKTSEATHAGLSAADVEAFGAEMDAIRDRVLADLGSRDADYIRRIVTLQRRLEVLGRSLLFAGFIPPAWLGGVAALSLSKILDNMEIGHNVMHGQYDWMGDPALDSRTFEWDTTCPAEGWRHSHNYVHHTFTNVVGKDRDVGYGVLRMSEDQPWRPLWLGNPVYALLLATFFQWGVALHDLETDRVAAGEKSLSELAEPGRVAARKAGRQALKDYVLFPLLTGPAAPLTLAGNGAANLARNLWAFTIIFCGHFPDGVEMFDEATLEAETRGQWYVRQVLGSANIEGGRVFHVLSGNLSHQIEHHLFPDLPAHRYAEIAAEVRDACRRYGLPYNTGRLGRQFGSVVRRIVRLALPRRRARHAGPEQTR